MLRLILMRHAKAEAAAGGSDRMRRLSGRGRSDATAAGEALASHVRPDLALVSDSARTIGTFERVAACFPPTLPNRAVGRLYGATPDAILAEIGAVPRDVRTLLVIGHNPGVGDLARRLTGRNGTDEALAALAAHFPTACFVVVSFDSDAWDRVEGPGRLDHLWTPSDAIGT